MRQVFVAGLVAAVAATAGVAQDMDRSAITGLQPYESPSCARTDYHEFDFLNGAWDMKVLKDGMWVAAGAAMQTPALGGCASMATISFDKWGELYRGLTGRDGFAAILISSFDPVARNWRQVWLDDMGGMVSTLRGRKYEDGMRFVGHAPGQSGAELQRHDWKIMGAGLIEYSFEQSTDGGQTWTLIGRAQLVRKGG